MFLKYLDTNGQISPTKLRWNDTITLMNIELLYKRGHNNLVSNALNRRKELITLELFMIVEDGLDDAEQDFLNKV